jgi:catechol 2,3-dioxygenase-like lactoylglutathione lyase family enzyme
MFLGVDHVGIGVGDMDKAMEFYGRRLGFTRVLFDHVGELPGLEPLTHRPKRKARTVMLRHENTTPLGSGHVKLVQVLDGDGPPPMPAAQHYGEVGICEVCLHTRGTEAVHRRLVDELGCESLMEPLSAVLEPNGVSCDLSYVADPWRGKVELIDWTGLRKALPGKPRLEGVNHVAFGVSDMAATREFYSHLGFTDLLFESKGFFDAMAPWYSGPLPDQHMVLVRPEQGAGIEPVRLSPLAPEARGQWGHVGPMEFAVGVSNIDLAVTQLQQAGVEFHSEPQTVDVGTGEWKYAYLQDPDGLYVSLVEARY